MQNNEKISIVVPIYNVEEYLSRCLDSIVNQTYTNIEIMLVDDGSPDNAGAICDDYATRDNRIRVFHIPNGGVAKARQLGVESSTGEYIVFVDPDDWLPLDSVEILYSNMSDDVDLVIGGHVVIYKYHTKRLCSTSAVIDRKMFLDKIISWDITVSPWGKIYRRSLFNSTSFPNVKHTQDLLMNVEVGSRVNSVCIIEDPVYYYTSRRASTARSFKGGLKYEMDFCQILEDILRI